MPIHPSPKLGIVKRTKREIPIFLPRHAPPQRVSRPLTVSTTTRATSPGCSDVSASMAGSASTVAASPQAVAFPNIDGPVVANGVRCDVCDAKADVASAEMARLPGLIAELAALADAIRPLVHAVHPVTEAPPTKSKRKYTRRMTEQKVDPVPLAERKWITIKQAAAIYPKSEQAFRHLIHQSSQYLKYPKAGLSSNGFEKCIARQSGSRNVYLVVEELDRWMAQGREGAQ